MGGPPFELVPFHQPRIVFCDGPYNFGKRYTDDTTHDALPEPQYRDLCETVIQQCAKLLCPGGTLWWLAPAAHVKFIPGMLESYVGTQTYMIVKEESFSQYQGKRKLTEDYRLLFCHTKPGGEPVFNPEAILIPSARLEKGDKRAVAAGRVPGQIWKIRRLQGTSDDHVDWHCAQLPPELLHRIVQGWSNPGEWVLDAFAGSGNMGLVTKATGRNVYLLDQSETYCYKMRERLGLPHHADIHIQ